MKIRGILFDKDGTILDYARTWVPINREAALHAASGDEALAAELLRAHGQDPDTGAVVGGSLLAAGSIAEIADAFAAHLGERTPAEPDTRPRSPVHRGRGQACRADPRRGPYARHAQAARPAHRRRHQRLDRRA